MDKVKLTLLKRKFKAYWEAFEWAIVDNEIELQNILFDSIVELIPFENSEEKETYLDYASTWVCLPLFREKTFAYFQRKK